MAAAGGLRNVMTAGNLGADTGYSQGSIGSLASPTTDIAGRTITKLFDDTGGTLTYAVSVGSDPGKTTFTTLTITGSAGLKTFSSASSSYSFSGGVATWVWGSEYGFVNSSSYQFQAK